MRLASIVRVYRARLRVRLVLGQELLAVVGLAVGVALLFASQVASSSLNHSVSQLSSDLVGNMQLQLQARSPRGFDGRLLGAVQRIPGVAEALPVLEAQADVIGPKGRESVDLLGTDPRFAHAGGPLLRRFSTAQLNRQRALALPAPVVASIGAESLLPIEIQVGTHVTETLLGATLTEADVGGLVNSPVAIAPVAYAEALTGSAGRVTRIFVRAEPGREAAVRVALVALAGDRLNVEPADFDSALFAKAAAPANQAAELFSAISALVGFMLAFNALLITAALRRELIGELRRHGATRWMTIKTLLFDALALGLTGCVLGLALGDTVSLALFHTHPGYLSYAFPVGSQRIVTWSSVALAVGAGMLAAFIGVLLPLRGELSRPLRRSGEAARQGRGEQAGRRWLGVAGGLACLGATTIILVFDPAGAVLGSLALVGALLLLMAPLFDQITAVFRRVSQPLRSAAMRLALIELRSPATRTRSLAIAATGAIAVFGSVAIQGAHGDLQSGLDRTASDMNRVTDIWVSAAGSANTLGTTPFAMDAAARLRRLPGVRSLSLYRGGFLDIGDRRAWIIAPPRSSPAPIPSSELVRGDLAACRRALAGGRLGCRVEGDRRRTAPADRRLVHAPLPGADQVQSRGAEHERRLATRGGRDRLRGLSPRVGQRRSKRLQHHPAPGDLAVPGGPRSAPGARGPFGTVGADRARARTGVACEQSPGAFAPVADRTARADRRGAGDGGGDRGDDLAAPPPACVSEAAGLPAQRALAGPDLRERPAARGGLLDRRGVRSLLPDPAQPCPGERHGLSGRVLGRCAGRGVERGARERRRCGHRRRTRLPGRAGAGEC